MRIHRPNIGTRSTHGQLKLRLVTALQIVEHILTASASELEVTLALGFGHPWLHEGCRVVTHHLTVAAIICLVY